MWYLEKYLKFLHFRRNTKISETFSIQWAKLQFLRSDPPPLVRTTTCDYISANKFRSKIRVLDKRGQDIYHPNTNNTSDIFKNITSLSYFFTRIILADARFLGLQPAILDIFVHIFWSKTIILCQNGSVETKKYIWHLQALHSYLPFFTRVILSLCWIF